MPSERPPWKLLDFADQSLAGLRPEAWIRPPGPQTAVLCWGKAATATAQALCRQARSRAVKIPALVISPDAPGPALARELARDAQWNWQWVRGEHPLPGPGSFAAGVALVPRRATGTNVQDAVLVRFRF